MAPIGASGTELAPRLEWLASMAADRRFDLLGSGWVEVAHGASCPGVEGTRYPAGEAVVPDPQGAWLAGRVTAPNLPEAKRRWALIDDAAYAPIDWQLDFKSGHRWSARTWHGDVRVGVPPRADVKVPWELARMQHLPLLALAAVTAESGPDRWARSFRAQVLDFCATNPPRFGVNWACPMDVGIRVANVTVAWDLFRANGTSFDAGFESVLAASVREHAEHLVTHLEWGPRGGANHYLANVCGLLFAAAHLARDPQVDAWLAFGIQELVRQTDAQFLADGGNFEGSTCYHRLSAEMVCWGTALVLGLPDARLEALASYDRSLHRVAPALDAAPMPTFDGSPLSPEHFERLERIAGFARSVRTPNGELPQFGDQDSGAFLKVHPRHVRASASDARAKWANLAGWSPPGAAEGDGFWWEEPLSAVGLLAVAETIVGSARAPTDDVGARLAAAYAGGVRRSPRAAPPTPAAPSSRPELADWEARIRALPAAQRDENEFRAGPLREGLRALAFPDFGLFVLRSDRLYLAIRCGSVGQRGNGGHAHNDQLGIELWIEGVPLVRDPGTYLYTADEAWRNRYRSVLAHFAPQVVGREPAELDLGIFRLPDRFGSVCHGFDDEGFVGGHRGYGPEVVRTVRVEPERIVVCDGLLGEEARDLRLRPLSDWEPPPWSPGYGIRAHEPVR